MKEMSPPYDLIKCDIEGKEWELLLHYPKVLSGAKYLILEWHSWHNGGGSLTQITKKLQEFGFSILKSSDTTKALGREGEVGLFLAENLSFNRWETTEKIQAVKMNSSRFFIRSIDPTPLKFGQNSDGIEILDFHFF